MEGEATCHYLNQEIFGGLQLDVTRTDLVYQVGEVNFHADEITLRSALTGASRFSKWPKFSLANPSTGQIDNRTS